MAEPINDYILQHVFDAGGYTGKTYYYRITDRYQSRVVHKTTKVLTAFDEIAWADGCIPMTPMVDLDSLPTGVYRIMFYALMPGGLYNVTVYEQLGAGPVPEDDVVEQGQHKHGSIFGF